MKIILAATDFSRNGNNAVRYAADMAAAIDARLTILHVYSLPPVYDAFGMPLYPPDDPEAIGRDGLAESQRMAEGHVNNRIAVTTLLRRGNVGQELVAACLELDPFAVVMGSESLTAAERWLIGGKTVQALHLIHHPLIVVPDGKVFGPIRKVGLACDLQDVEDTVQVRRLREILNEFKPELHVLHVQHHAREQAISGHDRELDLLKDLLSHLQPHYHFLRDEDTARGLSDFVEQNGIDLLIVIPKKHNVVRRFFGTSHAEDILFRSEIPVMAMGESS